MNEYRFEDLEIGQTESFQSTITEEMMCMFCTITGDQNPLHMQELFAREMGYENRVVYGMLSASFISTLGGMYLPGKYCLIQAVESKFVHPVYIGDTLTVEGEVEKLHESVKQAEIKVRIVNQKGEQVVRGKLKVGFLHE